jgi:glycosyltransferase involved in cell wall biosynthesis
MRAIDVVVPNYQYGRYLGHCITSVLRQDIDRLRLLIIDNASTDDSLEVAQQLARSDPRVQVVAHSSNLGHHASFNEGIDWASSDYFMLLCADDLLVPGCLSRAVAFMEAHPDVHLTFGRAARIQSDDSVPDVPAFQEASWHVMPGAELVEVVCRAGGRYSIDSSTVVVRTSAQKRVGRYRAELPFMDDLEMWLRFACLGRVASTSAVQGVFRIHREMRTVSLSALPFVGPDWDLQLEAAFESFFANEGASLPGARRLHTAARRSLAERAYWAALANLLRGELRPSLAHWRFAFSRRPHTMVAPPIGYLFRNEGALRRIAKVLLEAAGRLSLKSAKPLDGY